MCVCVCVDKNRKNITQTSEEWTGYSYILSYFIFALFYYCCKLMVAGCSSEFMKTEIETNGAANCVVPVGVLVAQLAASFQVLNDASGTQMQSRYIVEWLHGEQNEQNGQNKQEGRNG